MNKWFYDEELGMICCGDKTDSYAPETIVMVLNDYEKLITRLEGGEGD